MFHARTKHIEVDYHFVHEKVLRRDVMLKFISTHDQLADLFTKSLPSPRFNWLTSKLMWKFPISLKGDESHNNTGSTGCPEHPNHEEEGHPNHEEEEGTPTARTPTANSSRTVSYRRLGKHKGKVKQNTIVSH